MTTATTACARRGGQSLSLSQDFAGLGGSVKYVRTRANASKHFNLGSRFILNVSAEGGYHLSVRRPPDTDQRQGSPDRPFLPR